jgi:hypothetical protein
MLDRPPPLRILAAILIAITLAACAGPSPSFSGRITPDSTPLVVDVENRDWWDMEVELDAEGSQFRLGVAPSCGRVRFRVSASKLGDAGYFRLVANPMDTGREAFSSVTGRGVHITPVIDMPGHRQVRWTVGSSDATTSLIVR